MSILVLDDSYITNTVDIFNFGEIIHMKVFLLAYFSRFMINIMKIICFSTVLFYKAHTLICSCFSLVK